MAGQDEDARLLEGLRRGDAAVVAELYDRYVEVLVGVARQQRVPPSERRELARDVVAEVVMQLLRPGARMPRNLPGFLTTGLRRRVIDRRRRQARAPEVSLDETRDADVVDRVELEQRAPEAGGVHALARLADHLESHVDDVELHILHWLGERVPQRVIAEWLGMSHGALRMRVARLRDRLREVTRGYCLAVDRESQEQLARFFARYGRAPASSPSSPQHPIRGPGRAPGGRRHGSAT